MAGMVLAVMLVLMDVMLGVMVVLAMGLIMILLVLVLGMARVDSMELGQAMVALLALVLLVGTIHMQDRGAAVC